MHTAGFQYQPDFLWEVKDLAETQAIHGRSCRLAVAGGIAEYAQTAIRLWLCPSQDASERAVSDLVLRSANFAYRAILPFLAAEVARRPGVVLLRLEETIAPAIAPTMLRRVEAARFEMAPPTDVPEPAAPRP